MTSIAPWVLKEPMTNEHVERIISEVANRRSLPAANWLAGEDTDRASALLSNPYQQVVWVYRAINALAEQIANVPFLFSMGQRGHENLIPSGPLHAIYARPHPNINVWSAGYCASMEEDV